MPTIFSTPMNGFARCITLCILAACLSACQTRVPVVYPDGNKSKRVYVNAPKSNSDFNAEALRRDQ